MRISDWSSDVCSSDLAIRSLFTWDIDNYRDENYGDHYVEAVRRGHAVVSINVEESEVDRACDIMDDAGALAIDEKVSEWRSQGYSCGRQDAAGNGKSDMNSGDRKRGVTGKSVAVGVDLGGGSHVQK